MNVFLVFNYRNNSDGNNHPTYYNDHDIAVAVVKYRTTTIID